MKSREERKKTMKKLWLLQPALRITATVIVTVLLACVALANAADKKPDDGWQFEITPFIWLPTINGSMKLDQPPGFRDGKLDVDPGDYLENLDFTGMLDFQAKKGKWSLLADVIYLDFSDSETARFPGVLPGGGDWTVGADWELQALVFELVGAYSYAFS